MGVYVVYVCVVSDGCVIEVLYVIIEFHCLNVDVKLDMCTCEAN